MGVSGRSPGTRRSITSIFRVAALRQASRRVEIDAGLHPGDWERHVVPSRLEQRLRQPQHAHALIARQIRDRWRRPRASGLRRPAGSARARPARRDVCVPCSVLASDRGRPRSRAGARPSRAGRLDPGGAAPNGANPSRNPARVGVDVRTIRNAERGLRRPSQATSARLSSLPRNTPLRMEKVPRDGKGSVRPFYFATTIFRTVVSPAASKR
jgi:hypothetical protein